MITSRTLHTLLTSAMVALMSLSLAGCCCGLDSLAEKAVEQAAEEAIEELEKEAAKAEKEAEEADDDDEEDKKSNKKSKKDDDDDDKDSDGDAGGAMAVADASPKKLKKRVEALGWEVISQTDSKNLYILSVKKKTMFASVQLQDLPNKIGAKATEKALKKNGMAVERDGKKLLYVSIVNNPDAAAKLLNKLMGK